MVSLGSGASIQTTNKKTGAYALKQTATAGANTSLLVTGLGLTTCVYRYAFRLHQTTDGAWGADTVFLADASVNSLCTVTVNYSGAGAYTLVVAHFQGGFTPIGSPFAISLDTDYIIEVKFVSSTTVGVVELKVDGTVRATGSGLNTGTATVDRAYSAGLVTSGAPAGINFDNIIDDVWIGDAYTGLGRSILRKGKSGTPTYNAWTKQAGGNIDAEWLDLPYSATNNARSSAASQAQSILAADAAAGTDPIASSDTINACLIGAIIKRLTTTPSPTTQTRAPTSDVSFTGTWTGSAGTRFQAVDDHPDSGNPIADGLVHGTTTPGEGLFGFSAFTVPAGATSISVQVIYYDFKGGSQASSIGARIRCNDTTGRDAASHNPGNGNANIALRTDNYATNPKSGAAWTVNDVNGVGTNGLTAFGVVSTDANPAITLSSIMLQVTYTPGVSDGTYKLRRRLNGSDTDTAKTLTTTDAWYDDGFWTDTLVHLSSMEFGAFRDTGGDHNIQVEDIWLLVDYTPVTAITVTVNQVTETDLAQRLGVVANRTNETDASQAVTRQKARAVQQLNETDSVTAVGRAKARTLPQLNETDTVTTVTRVKARLLGQISEVDSSGVITPQLVIGSHTVTVNQVAETDTVFAVSWSPKNRFVGASLEMDSPQSVGHSKSRTIGQSAEVDLATSLQLLFHKLIPLLQTIESDLAQSIAVAGQAPVALFRAGRVPIRYTVAAPGVVPVRLTTPGAGVVPVVVTTVDVAGVVPCIITPDAAGVVPIVEEP